MLMSLLKKNKKSIITIIIIAVIFSILFYNRKSLEQSKLNIVRKVYKDEFDNFDIQAFKNYMDTGAFVEKHADANVVDYKPTKTSELVSVCDESIEECMEW